jgi:hypothetical protein
MQNNINTCMKKWISELEDCSGQYTKSGCNVKTPGRWRNTADLTYWRETNRGFIENFYVIIRLNFKGITKHGRHAFIEKDGKTTGRRARADWLAGFIYGMTFILFKIVNTFPSERPFSFLCITAKPELQSPSEYRPYKEDLLLKATFFYTFC